MKDEAHVTLRDHCVYELGQNEERHENVRGAGNIDSSANGDSAHLSLNQNVRMKRMQLLTRTSGLCVV
jgi:hypothetical protein